MKNELKHHDIKGQRWGVRNGPPYPLVRVVKGSRETSNEIFNTLDPHQKYLLAGRNKQLIKENETKYLVDQILVKYGNIPISAFDIWNHGDGNVDVSIETRAGYQGKGYADKAVKEGLKKLKKNKSIHNIGWGAFKTNTASRNLAEKNGFQIYEEGEKWVRYYLTNTPKNELKHHGIKGQRWGVRRFQNEDGTLTPAGRERYSANSLYTRGSKKVETIFNDVKMSAKLPNCKLYGTEHRLKTKESIQRKINKKTFEDGISPLEAGKNIKDVVRFTMISDDNNFVSNYSKFKEKMKKLGYDETRCKNYFEMYKQGKVKHKSVQSNFSDKEGYEFEIQFQTPSSQEAKDKKVPIYEERRRVGIDPQRAVELESQMVKLAEQVAYPKDINKIKSH